MFSRELIVCFSFVVASVFILELVSNLKKFSNLFSHNLCFFIYISAAMCYNTLSGLPRPKGLKDVNLRQG
jgi:hypothetical protein